MKTFYSLIKVSPNTFSGDTITIGIILRDKNGFRVKVSESKKQIAKKLLIDQNESIDFLLKQINLKIQEVNSNSNFDSKKLFKYEDLLNDNYFEYLSRYNNGLLQFSSPYVIEDAITEDNFQKLYHLFVDKTDKPNVKLNSDKDQESRFFSEIQNRLITRVKEKVHTNITIDSKIVPSFLSHFEIDCIGLNGAFVGAKALPINHTKQTISANINTFTTVIALLSAKYKKDITKNSIFLISDEPKDVGSSEHRTWEELNKSELFKVICSEQSDLVAKKIEESKAKTFLEVV